MIIKRVVITMDKCRKHAYRSSAECLVIVQETCVVVMNGCVVQTMLSAFAMPAELVVRFYMLTVWCIVI